MEATEISETSGRESNVPDSSETLRQTTIAAPADVGFGNGTSRGWLENSD